MLQICSESDLVNFRDLGWLQFPSCEITYSPDSESDEIKFERRQHEEIKFHVEFISQQVFFPPPLKLSFSSLSSSFFSFFD
jgi:hypothetical protein